MTPRFKTAKIGDLVHHYVPFHLDHWYVEVSPLIELWLIIDRKTIPSPYGLEYIFKIKCLWKNREKTIWDDFCGNGVREICDSNFSAMNEQNTKEQWVIL